MEPKDAELFFLHTTARNKLTPDVVVSHKGKRIGTHSLGKLIQRKFNERICVRVYQQSRLCDYSSETMFRLLDSFM